MNTDILTMGLLTAEANRSSTFPPGRGIPHERELMNLMRYLRLIQFKTRTVRRTLINLSLERYKGL